MRLAPLVAVATALAALLALPAASAAWGMPEALTERGQTISEIYEKIALVGALVFVFVFALLVWILARYRESTGRGRSTHEAHRGSLKAELLWTVVPLAIMLWIGVMSYAGLVKLDRDIPLEDAEMSVTITGYQWVWQMDYGNGVLVSVSASPDAEGHLTYSDTFHLPADTNVLFNITGGDVIHAFNIIDANRAYVTMDDANPSGPHQVHQQVHSLPEGTYTIQCKEMCLNPGHGYMRAELIVEPMADFAVWLKERTLAAGADLVTKVHVDATATTLTAADTTVVTGSRVLVELTNKDSKDLTVKMPGGLSEVVIQAGTTDFFAFNTAVAGDFTITASNGASLAFHSIEATPIQVDLGNYKLIPDHLELKAGTTYLIQVKNVHSTQHNLYIGDRGSEIASKSATIGPAASASFVWTPTAGDYDMWCDVPGHFDLGMKGTVTVA